MSNIADIYLKEISFLQEQVVRLQSENIKLNHKLKLEEEKVNNLHEHAVKLWDRLRLCEAKNKE